MILRRMSRAAAASLTLAVCSQPSACAECKCEGDVCTNCPGVTLPTSPQDSGNPITLDATLDGASVADARSTADAQSDGGVPDSPSIRCYDFRDAATCPASCYPSYRWLADGGMGEFFCLSTPQLVSCEDSGATPDAGDGSDDGGCMCIPAFAPCGWGSHRCCPLLACIGSAVCIDALP